MRPKTLRDIAQHESCHALIASLAGFQVDEVRASVEGGESRICFPIMPGLLKYAYQRKPTETIETITLIVASLIAPQAACGLALSQRDQRLLNAYLSQWQGARYYQIPTSGPTPDEVKAEASLVVKAWYGRYKPAVDHVTTGLVRLGRMGRLRWQETVKEAVALVPPLPIPPKPITFRNREEGYIPCGIDWRTA